MRELKIPKKIHYFWFGGAAKPNSVLRCIDSWKKFCPDFEIIEWNENNYDIHKHPFMEKAFNDKKWAFISDYARLDVLIQQGGIYLDTDVEVLKDLAPLCENQAFIGFENSQKVGDGQGFGAVPDFPLFKEMLLDYDDLDEYIESPKLRTKVLLDHGLRLDGSRQNIEGIEIYPVEFFCPKNWATGKITVTDNTYSIHHFDASWQDKKAHRYISLMRVLDRMLGEEKGKSTFDKIIFYKDKVKGRQ
ncbi:Mannosyltransferase OCH1 and related enzymes [Butyrivibrio fibrisolvens 16/4]|nr:Mannosyltransferase OCH1 and related enzymes [Butyrivibrio fibrisolvens 16/4]